MSDLNKFELRCPQCNVIVEADEGFIGKTAECPECHSNFVINAPKSAEVRPKVVVAAQNTESEEKRSFIFSCPDCATEIELPMILFGKKYCCQKCFGYYIAESDPAKCYKLGTNTLAKIKSKIPPLPSLPTIEVRSAPVSRGSCGISGRMRALKILLFISALSAFVAGLGLADKGTKWLGGSFSASSASILEGREKFDKFSSSISAGESSYRSTLQLKHIHGDISKGFEAVNSTTQEYFRNIHAFLACMLSSIFFLLMSAFIDRIFVH